jgi:hypothetical protein
MTARENAGHLADTSVGSVFVFSSAYRDRYKQDVLDSLGGPTGYCVHFRYKESHLHRDVWELAKEDHLAFRKKPGYLLFVHQKQKEKHDSEADRFDVKGLYPLRQIVIEGVEIDGDVLHLFFSVGDYFDPSLFGSHGDPTEEIRSALGDGAPPHAYVSMADHCLPWMADHDPQSQQMAWAGLCDLLGGFDRFRDTFFYRATSLHPLTCPAQAVPVRYIAPRWRSGYRLSTGTYYVLNVSFRVPEETLSDIEGSRLVPRVDERYFSFKPDPVTVDFHYDMQRIDLVVARTSIDIHTKLVLHPERPSSEQPDLRAAAPKLDFTLEIRYSRRRFAAALSFLIVGLTVGVASSLDRVTSLWPNAQVVGVLLVGTILAGLGSWLLRGHIEPPA